MGRNTLIAGITGIAIGAAGMALISNMPTLRRYQSQQEAEQACWAWTQKHTRFRYACDEEAVTRQILVRENRCWRDGGWLEVPSCVGTAKALDWWGPVIKSPRFRY